MGVFFGPFFFWDTPHVPERTRRNARTLNWTFHFSSTFPTHWTHICPNRQNTQKVDKCTQLWTSGPVLPKIRAFFCHFWTFLGKISTLWQENCFIEAFAIQCCPFRYYLLLIALTLSKITQHGLDMAFFGNFGPYLPLFVKIIILLRSKAHHSWSTQWVMRWFTWPKNGQNCPKMTKMVS